MVEGTKQPYLGVFAVMPVMCGARGHRSVAALPTGASRQHHQASCMHLPCNHWLSNFPATGMVCIVLCTIQHSKCPFIHHVCLRSGAHFLLSGHEEVPVANLGKMKHMVNDSFEFAGEWQGWQVGRLHLQHIRT